MLSAVCEIFCDVHGPQFNVSNLDIVDTFDNIFDRALIQLIVNETTKSSVVCEFSTCFLISVEWGRELTNQYVHADTNKTSAIVTRIKLVEHLLSHGHTLDNIFIILQSWPNS